MGILDIILLLVFIPEIIHGLTKGLIRQVAGLIAVVLGVWLAIHYTPDVAKWLGMQIEAGDQVVRILSFTVVMLTGVAAFELLGILATKLVDIASLGVINRVAGMLFGALKTAVLLAILVFVFDSLNGKWELVAPEHLEGSVVYTWLKGFAPRIFPYLKELVSSINV